MDLSLMTRRELLRLAGIMAATQVVGCGTNFPQVFGGGGGVVVFRRTSRGMHQSQAVKNQNANRLYDTVITAQMDLAHPGDRSKVVPVSISRDLNAALFSNGNQMVDLRQFFA